MSRGERVFKKLFSKILHLHKQFKLLCCYDFILAKIFVKADFNSLLEFE